MNAGGFIALHRKIKNIMDKRLIEAKRASLDEQIEMSKERFFNAGTAEEQDTVVSTIEKLIDHNQSLGVISAETAVTKKQGLKKAFIEENLYRLLDNDPFKLYERLENNDIKNLSKKETVEWKSKAKTAIENQISFLDKEEARVKKENYDIDWVSALSGELTREEVIKSVNLDRYDAEEGNKLLKLIDAKQEDVKTDISVWNDLREKARDIKDDDEFKRAVEQAVSSDKNIETEDGQELIKYREKFKEDRNKSAIKNSLNAVKNWANQNAFDSYQLADIQANIESRIDAEQATGERIQEITEEEKHNFIKSQYPEINGLSVIPNNIYQDKSIDKIIYTPEIGTPDMIYNPQSGLLEKNTQEGKYFTTYVKDKGISVGFPQDMSERELRMIIGDQIENKGRLSAFQRFKDVILGNSNKAQASEQEIPQAETVRKFNEPEPLQPAKPDAEFQYETEVKKPQAQFGYDTAPDLDKYAEIDPTLKQQIRQLATRSKTAVVDSFEIAEYGLEIGRIGHAIKTGKISKEDGITQTKQIERLIQDIRNTGDIPDNLYYNILSSTSSLVPYIATSAMESAKQGAAAGTGAALVATAAGQIPPFTLTVEEAFTVPAAWSTGFAVGATYGSVKTAREIEGGKLYLDMISGGVDETTSRILSDIAGISIGLIEASQIGRIAKKLPGGKTLFKQKLMEQVKKQSVKELLKTAGKEYGKDIVVETAQELTQEGISISAEALGYAIQAIKDDTEYKGVTAQQALDRMIETTKASLYGFPVIMLPGTINRTISDLRANSRVSTPLAKEVIENINMEAEQSGFIEAPEGLEDEFPAEKKSARPLEKIVRDNFKSKEISFNPKERKTMHVPKENEVVKNVSKTFEEYESLKNSESPVAHFITGPTAASKTTLAKTITEQGQNIPVIDPDEFKRMIHGYTEDKSNKYQKAGTIANNIAVEYAVENGIPFINSIPGTNANKFNQVFDTLTQRGYQKKVDYIFIPLEESVERSQYRYQNEQGIGIDEKNVSRIYKKSLDTLFKVFIPKADIVQIYSNERTDDRSANHNTVATFKNGKLFELHDEKSFEQLIREWYRSNENREISNDELSRKIQLLRGTEENREPSSGSAGPSDGGASQRNDASQSGTQDTSQTTASSLIRRSPDTAHLAKNLQPAKSPEELKTRIDQLNKFAMSNAILRRTGGLQKQGSLSPAGQFVGEEKPGEIRLKGSYIKNEYDYVSTLAHELGHAVEYNITGTLNKQTVRVFGDDLDEQTIRKIETELFQITRELEGDAAIQNNLEYYAQPTELLARFFEKMIASPANLEEIAPTAMEYLERQRIKQPLINEFLEAAIGNIDKGTVQTIFLRDLRETYQKYLGKRVGDIAYNAEINHRAMQERAKIVIEKFIKEKFESINDNPETLFRAAESILITKKNQPVFGTRDFITAKNKTEEANAIANGFEFVEGVEDKESGNVYPLYARQRYTPQQAKAIFESLSAEGQQLIKDFTAAREEAKDYFNREIIKDVAGIESNIEGWVHHYFDNKGTLGTRSLKFKEKTAGTRRKREGAEGYVEDFQLAMTKALTELEGEKVFNAFIKDQFARVTKPIPEGGKPDAGWVEVIGDVQKGVGTTQEKKVVMIQDGKTFVPKRPRYQMPKPIYERYKLWRGLTDEASTAMKIFSDLNRYWRINILTHPGSAGTNFISGGIQYASKILTDFYSELLTGKTDFTKTRADINAMLTVITPKGWADAPDWVYGSDLSNYYGQFTNKEGVNQTLDKYADQALTLYGGIERYWKKVIATAEGVQSLKDLENISKEGLRLPTKEESELIAKINQEIDLFAFDYDNIPTWLANYNKNALAQAVKPFATYPYKYIKHIVHMIGQVFDRSLPWQERAAKLLALTTIVSAYAAIKTWRKSQQETPEGTADVPARVTPRGKLFIGADKDGKELFIRTAKYPYLNLTDTGIALVNGEYEAAVDGISDMIGSVGPTGKIGLLALGYRNKYQMYDSTPEILAETASEFVPGVRMFDSISRMLDPFARKEETVFQAFTRLIPVTSEALQEKLHGSRRTVKVPIEGDIRKKPGEGTRRTTTDREIENYWNDILLSALSGIYITRIDPKEAEAFQIRDEKKKRKDENKN